MRIPKKEGWHITVVFCGYLDDKEIEVLTEIVKNTVSKSEFMEFVPQRILFAPPSRPRMIWLSFGASSQFGELKTGIENAIISRQKEGLFKNFRSEKREPKPHLTLARFEEGYFAEIREFFPKEGIDLKKEARPFFVEHIDIMESRLSRSGAEYELIASFNLSKNSQSLS